MFEGRKYKKIAKKLLKGRIGMPMLVCLIEFCFSVILAVPEYLGKHGLENIFTQIYITKSCSVVSFVVSSIVNIAVVYFFIRLVETRDSKLTFDTFLNGLSLWWKGILCSLWRSLWIFLWMLLFFIPGIIKAIAYSQMFFIVAENPRIGVDKALKISKAMTQGHKGDLFGLYLSFIGWVILCAVPFVFLWVCPYYNATMAVTYKSLKDEAIKEGRLTPEDFE